MPMDKTCEWNAGMVASLVEMYSKPNFYGTMTVKFVNGAVVGIEAHQFIKFPMKEKPVISGEDGK